MSQQLIILCGIPFAGKSVVAQTLVDEHGYVRIDLDKIKYQLLGSSVDSLIIETTPH